MGHELTGQLGIDQPYLVRRELKVDAQSASHVLYDTIGYEMVVGRSQQQIEGCVFRTEDGNTGCVI